MNFVFNILEFLLWAFGVSIAFFSLMIVTIILGKNRLPGGRD